MNLTDTFFLVQLAESFVMRILGEIMHSTEELFPWYLYQVKFVLHHYCKVPFDFFFFFFAFPASESLLLNLWVPAEEILGGMC